MQVYWRPFCPTQWIIIRTQMVKKIIHIKTKLLNAITSELNKKDPPPSDSETDSEAKRIAEQYPYTDSEDEN